MADPQSNEPLRLGSWHTSLSPWGIEVAAAVMHVVYAHKGQKEQTGDGPHHQRAVEYLMEFRRFVQVERIDADASSATYIVNHPNLPTPQAVRVLLGRPLEDCVEMRGMATNGPWVRVDITRLHIQGPR